MLSHTKNSKKDSNIRTQNNISSALGVASVSTILGILLIISSILLLEEITPQIDKCYDPQPTRACYPVYGDAGATILGILLGLFQIIIFVVSLFRRATCSTHTILASQFAIFILSIILFSLTVYNDGTIVIESLKLTSSTLTSKLCFFYSILGFNWIYSLFAVILAKRCL